MNRNRDRAKEQGQAAADLLLHSRAEDVGESASGDFTDDPKPAVDLTEEVGKGDTKKKRQP